MKLIRRSKETDYLAGTTGEIVLQPLVLYKRGRAHLLILYYTTRRSKPKVTKYTLLFTCEYAEFPAILNTTDIYWQKQVQNTEYEIRNINTKKIIKQTLFGCQYDCDKRQSG